MHLAKIAVLVLCILCFADATQAAQNVRIGVLSYRGPEAAEVRWKATADYLTEAIPEFEFEIVPLTVDSMESALDGANLSFLLTSPGSYVDLSSRYGIASILTLKSRGGGGSGVASNRIGAVIFTLADRDDIQSLSDLKGKSLGAVAPDSFDDFQIAWGEMKRQGIDPYLDLSAVKFVGMPKDAVVRAVDAEKVDAGVARSGLLEMMAAEGHLDLARFRVLNAREEAGFPFRLSTRLYPEWPLAAMPQTPASLSEKVVGVLLGMASGNVAAERGMYAGWTVPVSDKPVHDLMRDLRIGPYAGPDSSGPSRQWSALLLLFAVIVFSVLAVLYLRRSRATTIGKSEIPSEPQSTVGVPMPDTAEVETARNRLGTLTEREREVLDLIVHGDANKEIARSLNISPRTVEFHRANVMQKMSAGSVAELIRTSIIIELFQIDR